MPSARVAGAAFVSHSSRQANGSKIAFVAENPGDWMFHCHILEHQKAGMMEWSGSHDAQSFSALLPAAGLSNFRIGDHTFFVVHKTVREEGAAGCDYRCAGHSGWWLSMTYAWLWR